MKLDRDKIKNAIEHACTKAFAERGTINVVLAKGLACMVDSICDELEAQSAYKTKKVA